jgi:hypothetical protein
MLALVWSKAIPEHTSDVAARDCLMRCALRTLSLVLCLAAGGAQAAECTAALEKRWTAATREDERGAQIIARESKKGAKANKAAICKVAQTVPNLLKAAKEYYEACGPDDAAEAIATIQAHADKATAFYEAHCQDLRPTVPAQAPAAKSKT